MTDLTSNSFPARLTLRETHVRDEYERLIFTTAKGHGYAEQEYVRADLIPTHDKSPAETPAAHPLPFEPGSPERNAVEACNEEDAERYRWLRDRRSIPQTSYPSIPWPVRVELNPWPTTVACWGIDLDHAIDKAIEARTSTAVRPT